MYRFAKPFFALAPMDDVTDTVFRQVINDCAAPDLAFTEFVNVDGLMSSGRPKLMKKLRFVASEKNLVAQLWGLKPENFKAVAEQIVSGQIQEEFGLPRCPVHHTSRSSAFSQRSTEGAVQTVQRVSTAAEKSAGPEKPVGISGNVRKQDGRCVCGIVGVDLNMGCPAKSEVQNGTCSALIKIENRDLAEQIIDATREGLDGKLPLSVKTRVGFNEVDMTWFEFLLGKNLDMLTIHGRTRKEMSKVPANWDLIGQIREMRDQISPSTLIVGNGDVQSRQHGEELAAKYNLDGIMIGRGVFHDPFVFAQTAPLADFESFSSDARRRIPDTAHSASQKKDQNSTQTSGSLSPWPNFTKEQRVGLYRKHVLLFAKTWQNGERNIKTLNKFCKVYISDFDGAKELREQLMATNSADELLELLHHPT